MTVTIAVEPPGMPEAEVLILQSDRYLLDLYPEEVCYRLDIAGLERSEVRFVVARDDGRAVGCGAIVERPAEWELKRIFVTPESRGNGIGRQLVEILEGFGRRAGAEIVRLETGIHQPEALMLYQHLGYSTCGPFADYRPNAYSIFMEKRLAP